MNRENALFAICGFLLGVIAGAFFLGEMVHDARVARGRDASPVETPSRSGAAAGVATPSADVMTLVREQIERLNQLLSLEPNNVEALIQLGNLYMDAAKYSEAIGYYERALKIRKDPHVATDLGICYHKMGRHQDALRIFEQVHREHPAQWQALYNQAVVFVDLKEYAKARAAVAQLRRERPDDAEVLKFQQTLAQLDPTR